jgi:DNA-binding CsgD family transcriptional regulator
VNALPEEPAVEPIDPADPAAADHGVDPAVAEELGLSTREAEILALIATGHSNLEIAERCFLSINTVKSYVRTTYRKIGVQTRAQAVAWAIHHGLE